MIKGVSLREIALRAGVSPTTVSFVLNGKAEEKRISKDVCQRVQQLAKELGYTPNPLARGLRTGQTQTIGLMVEDIANHFFASLAKVIEDTCNNQGYLVLYCGTEDNLGKARNLMNMLRNRQLDGLIITPPDHLESEVQAFLAEKRPLVLLDRYFTGIDCNAVVTDNFDGGLQAGTLLGKCGYQHLAVVTTTSRQIQMRDRLEGFEQAVQQGRFRMLDPASILELPFQQDPSICVREIAGFIHSRKPDAVFFTTNYLGIYGIEAIRSLDLQIPRDIGLVSYDDHDVFRLLSPGITCISQPIAQIGRAAVELLLHCMREGGKPAQTIRLPPSLIQRGSTRTSMLP